MPQCHFQGVLQRVASALHVAVSDLPAEWESLAAQATKDAAADLDTILAMAGFSSEQIQLADQLASWQERVAFIITMQRGAALASYNLEALQELDPREALRKAASILINGVPVAAGPSAVGGIGFGRLEHIRRLEDKFNKW